MAPEMSPVSKERLQGLMLVRVVLITLFLGGFWLFESQSNFSAETSAQGVILIFLIVGTYALTIAYSLFIQRTTEMFWLAAVQITVDILSTAILVGVTGSSQSIFVLVFYLNVVSAAVVSGRRLAYFSAAATVLMLLALLVIETGLSIGEQEAQTAFFQIALHVSALVIIGLLSGTLAERLGQATRELQDKQANLEELEALNENIVSSLSSGLVTVDPEGRMIYFNQAAQTITGRKLNEILGANIASIFPEIARDISSDLLEETLGQPRYEISFRRTDGSRIQLGLTLSRLTLPNEPKAGWIIVFRDLTEVRKLEGQMRRSERLAAVGELAAAIAHEIRNPLASISGSVEMLQHMGEVSDDGRTLLDITLREVERLDALIREFLDYCRPTDLVLHDVDLRPLIDDVLTLFDHQGKSIEVLRQPAQTSEPAVARIDAEAIRQVLWNILNNAAHAAAEGSTSPQIQVELIQGAARWTIAVEDSGPGIEAEAQDRLFEPFFTTKSGGSGLGLAVCHRVVEEHQGLISVTDGHTLRGARFEVRLPRGSRAISEPVVIHG